MMKGDIAGRRSARPVPVSFGDVDVFCAMAREHFGKARAPQIFHLLLPDPRTMVLRFGLPIKIHAAEIAAGGMAFEDYGSPGERTQQQIESCGIGVRSGCVTMPRDFD